MRAVCVVLAVLAGCGDGGGGTPCPAIAPNCDDGDPCTIDRIEGSCPGTCRHDPVPAGTADQCCPIGATQLSDPDCAPRCGDDVIDPGEQCDDGNTASFDGCSASCQIEHAFVIDSLAFEDLTQGCDLDGNGQIDNVIGRAMNDNMRQGFNSYAQAALMRNGLPVTLLVLTDLHDLALANDPGIHLGAFLGRDSDGVASNNFTGDALFTVAPHTIENAAPVDGWAQVTIGQNILDGRAPKFILPMAIFASNEQRGDLVEWGLFQLHQATLTVGSDGRPTALSGGRMCGALTIPSAAGFSNLTTAPGATFLDVLVLGADLFGYVITPTQADIDLDDDGLEVLMDTDNDHNIDLCVDGNGTQIVGASCVADPRIADGFSTSVAFHAVGARLGGIAPQ